MSVSPKARTLLGSFSKYVLGVWGVPIAIVVVAFVAMPDPGRPKNDQASAIFIPKDVTIHQGRGRKNATYWDLLILHPDGAVYYLRNPESGPIAQLQERIPRDAHLRLTYTPESEANLLLAIERADGIGQPILSYESTMAEYAQRRTLIFSIAAIWLALGNLLAWGLYRVKPLPSRETGS